MILNECACGGEPRITTWEDKQRIGCTQCEAQVTGTNLDSGLLVECWNKFAKGDLGFVPLLERSMRTKSSRFTATHSRASGLAVTEATTDDDVYPYLRKGATLQSAGFTASDLATARLVIAAVKANLEENFESASESIVCLEEALVELPMTITETIGE